MYPILAIISDLHVDMYKNMDDIFELFDKPDHKDMILCLAGDVFTDTSPTINQIENFLKKCANYFKHVVFVAGNHDLWGHNIIGDNSFDEQMINSNVIHSNIHYLTMDDTTIIDDIEFWGHTFWSKVDKGNEVIAIQGLGDYANIYSLHNNELYVHQTNEINANARNHLKGFLNWPRQHEYNTANKRVIMTHFPLFREHVQDNPSPVDVYFNNQMDYELAYLPQPDLYIYGHTHTAEDYDFMGARVICNPRGYPSQSGNFKMKYFTFGEISEQN